MQIFSNKLTHFLISKIASSYDGNMSIIVLLLSSLPFIYYIFILFCFKCHHKQFIFDVIINKLISCNFVLRDAKLLTIGQEILFISRSAEGSFFSFKFRSCSLFKCTHFFKEKNETILNKI